MLFSFERRAITNVLCHCQLPWNNLFPTLYKVERLGGSLSLFNEDYSLQFIERSQLDDKCKSAFSAILPFASGAELFVMVDELTGRLCIAELLGGEVFSAKYFRQFLTLLAVALQSAELPAHVDGPIYPGISTRKPVAWRQLLDWPVIYAWIIRGELCFFLGDRQVWTARDSVAHPVDLRCNNNSHFVAHLSGGRIVAIEGWMSVPVSESEWKLMEVID